MRILYITLLSIAAIFFLLWLGLQIKPKSFEPYKQESPISNYVSLPEGLPAPVERFYKTVYGDTIPLIETVVIKGRADISPFGIKFPARFIFVHNAGKDYRHYIEATWFGIPFMKVNESYVNGNSHFEIPIQGTYDNDPSITQGAALGLWAEASWFPAIWATDARVHWEPVDENTALLYVPFKDQEENFVVRFDPATGLLVYMETMRCRDAGQELHKILWITNSIPGKTLENSKLSAIGSATWFDQGKPWVIFTLEEIKYNVDVKQYIRQKGP